MALRLTVSEDKPLKGESVLVDRLEDSILDAMGFLEECLKESGIALQAAGYPGDMDRVRRALITCQERFHHVERGFASELVSYERQRDLATLTERRGGAWLSWGKTVKHGLEECRSPMEAVSSALAGCWQEIAERVGVTSVSVRTTNIGQKIVAQPSELEEMGFRE